jgi:hypothetical protein
MKVSTPIISTKNHQITFDESADRNAVLSD